MRDSEIKVFIVVLVLGYAANRVSLRDEESIVGPVGPGGPHWSSPAEPLVGGRVVYFSYVFLRDKKKNRPLCTELAPNYSAYSQPSFIVDCHFMPI